MMGLGTGLSSWYVPHSVKMPEVLCYTYLPLWTFSISGSLITYGSLITNVSPITNNCGWWIDSTFWSCPQGEPWLPMPTCGHLMLEPWHLCMTPLLDPWSGHRWHKPLLEVGLGVWPGSAGGSSPWLLLWLGTFPPMPEVLLNWVEDLLMDILCHLCFAWVHAGHPLQLIHFVVYSPKLLPNLM